MSIIGQEYHERVIFEECLEVMPPDKRDALILRTVAMMAQRVMNAIQHAAQQGEIVGAKVEELYCSQGAVTLRVAFTEPAELQVSQ